MSVCGVLCYILLFYEKKRVNNVMSATVIKYCSILLCCFYLYLKLLHIDSSINIWIKYLVFLLLVLPGIYFLRIYVQPFSIFIIVASFTFFVGIVIKSPINLLMTTSVVSFGIAYFTFFFTSFLISFSIFIISFFIKGFHLSNPLYFICIGIIQFVIATIPFKLKRLKNGMPFLQEHGSSEIGAYISITVLLAASFLGMNGNTELVYIIPYFFVVVCGLVILFWWRSRLSAKYIDTVKAKELETLRSSVQEKENTIEYLKSNNATLSKIIHKDNKLIPAMEYAVRELLLSIENTTDHESNTIQAKQLLAQLESVSKERSGILKSYESDNKQLPKSSVPSIDTVLSYMFQKARMQQVDLDLSLSGSVKYLIKTIISESDLNTLLADLIDNAIVATKKSTRKSIVVHIGICNDFYVVDVFDTGEPFSLDTMLNAGLRPATTHEAEGGSGIGLMTTFELLKKYHASFVIEDFLNDNLFTKKVSICFDQLGQYRIKSIQANQIRQHTNRSDIVFVNDDCE